MEETFGENKFTIVENIYRNAFPRLILSCSHKIEVFVTHDLVQKN